MKKIVATLICGIVIINASLAQTPPSYSKTKYRDAQGKLYWNKDLPVFISISDSENGERENLKGQITGKYDNPFYFDTEGLNYIRSKWAVDKNTKKTVTPVQELLFEVYADGVAPYTTGTFSETPWYMSAGKKIYGPGLTLKLTSKDGVSGVQYVHYSVNGERFAVYSDDIQLRGAGEYTIKYFSVDNVGNSEEVREKKVWVDTESPETNCTVLGVKLGDENIVSLKSKIFLEAKDNLAGVKKTYYRLDGGTLRTSLGNPLNLSTLDDGSHVLTYYSVDKVNNQETEQEFRFYLDKTAPITASDILGDRFIVNDQIYFSGRTKLKLTAVDNKSGVKEVLYSIDNEPFEPYEDPFYLPSKQGIHIIKYFALDNTENVTASPEELGQKYLQFKHTVDKIYLDLTGPSLNYTINGEKFYTRDTVFVGPNTNIRLTASDQESGLQYIAYSIDNAQKETVYKTPFTLGEKGSGMHKIEYFGYDNVNNRNIGQFNVFLDSEGPKIDYEFSVPSLGQEEDGTPIYPAYCSLFLTAQDQLTGIGKMYYSINGGDFVYYRNFVTNFKKNKKYSIKAKVYDRLGNETIRTIQFKTSK